MYKNQESVSTTASSLTRYTMKEMNKALVMNLQKHHQKLAKLTATNTNLQAELFNLMTERNSLMDENRKLIETLNSIKEQIGGVLGSNRSERANNKQSPKIGPMVSGDVFTKPKIKSVRFNSSNFSSPSNVQDDNDEIRLSTIAEEQEIENDELKNTVEKGRSFTENGRNSSSLLTINLMSHGNNDSSSSNPGSPSLFLNVFPRRRKCASKQSLSNGTSKDSIQSDGGLISETEERPKIKQRKKTEKRREFKASNQINQMEKSESNKNTGSPTTFAKMTENKGVFKVSNQINTFIKSEDNEYSGNPTSFGIVPKRRSSRIRKEVTYN